MSRMNPPALVALLMLSLLPIQAGASGAPNLLWDFGPARKSYRFYFNKFHNPILTQLREQYALEGVIAGARSDLERVERLARWVSLRWAHSREARPQKADPLAILDRASRGERFACLEYSFVLAGCLNSVGIRARVIDLMPLDVESRRIGAVHVVVEAFLPDRRKWVMADGQFGAVPVLKGYPLNAVELQAVLAKGTSGLTFVGLADSLDAGYREWIVEYLHFFQTLFDGRIHGTQLPKRVRGGLILVPLGSERPRTFLGSESPVKDQTSVLAEFYARPE